VQSLAHKSNAIFLAHKDAIHKAHLSINAVSYPRRLIEHDSNKLFYTTE